MVWIFSRASPTQSKISNQSIKEENVLIICLYLLVPYPDSQSVWVPASWDHLKIRLLVPGLLLFSTHYQNWCISLFQEISIVPITSGVFCLNTALLWKVHLFIILSFEILLWISDNQLIISWSGYRYLVLLFFHLHLQLKLKQSYLSVWPT